MAEGSFRAETDSMGEVRVPSHAYWGAQTQRAVENFSVSDLRIPVPLVRALGLVKQAAASVNGSLGLLEPPVAQAIERAAQEMAEGKWDGHFPIDVFQTGSGTSWNMNANEVIANRANELLGVPLGSKSRAPQRPREPRAVIQRRDPHGHQHCQPRSPGRPRGDDGSPAGQPCAQGRRVRRSEDRAHAPAGCGAHDPRAGVLGICPPGGEDARVGACAARAEP